MNQEIVRLRLASIRRCADDNDDDEAAHGNEDSLYFDVLYAIAHGTCEEPEKCARLAVTSKKIKFYRWCA